jgi:hypothetical protein
MGAVDDSVEATEIWIARRDGSSARRLLRGRANGDMRFVLAGLSSMAFSADGNRIFFLSRAWVVSKAVHVVDVATSRDQYVASGNDFRVILRGDYAGCLIVRQHRYYPLGGSYDFYWLTSQSGKDLGLVHDADWSKLAANRFAALGMSSNDSTATSTSAECK